MQRKDSVICKICGKALGSINYLHLRIHNLSTEEYMKQFPDAVLSSKEMLEKRSKSLTGKKRTELSKQKLSDSIKSSWQRDPNQGRTGHPLSTKSKKALSNKLKGHAVSAETRQKIGISALGREPWNKGITKRDDARLQSVSEKVKIWNKESMTDEKKQQISQTLKKRYADGMKIPNAKVGIRKDIGMSFRSTWEANFARILLYQGKDIIYEQDRFVLRGSKEIKHVYTPDFRLEQKKYVEIKGHASSANNWDCNCSRCKRDKTKHEFMSIQYPDVMIVIVGKAEYRKLAMYFFGDIEHWEFTTYDPDLKQDISASSFSESRNFAESLGLTNIVKYIGKPQIR